MRRHIRFVSLAVILLTAMFASAAETTGTDTKMKASATTISDGAQQTITVKCDDPIYKLITVHLSEIQPATKIAATADNLLIKDGHIIALDKHGQTQTDVTLNTGDLAKFKTAMLAEKLDATVYDKVKLICDKLGTSATKTGMNNATRDDGKATALDMKRLQTPVRQ